MLGLAEAVNPTPKQGENVHVATQGFEFSHWRMSCARGCLASCS
jgi:hypothetical protein